MASLRERRRADGTRSFAVLWRDPETGRQTSLTYDDEREARVAKELIEAAGGYATEAARIAEAVRKPHTQLGWKVGRSGDYPQAREFGSDGRPVLDVDFTDHGRSGNHPSPHTHR